jgi:hypothetical protein
MISLLSRLLPRRELTLADAGAPDAGAIDAHQAK